MQFMIIVKSTIDSEAGVLPDEKLMTEVAGYHEERPKPEFWSTPPVCKSSAKDWWIRYSGNKQTFVDGPFTETKELVAGCTK
ncbi:MAG TPA: hypothetical protein DDY32_09735 [Desulfobulbaceae bacterium]|nr:hypothetical protein [Desulfobulbaceae bacterium]